MKICVYAICKNESMFVKRWLDSMSEADYIVVLDTGSTDNTVELLKKDERVTVVESKTYEKWRFDTARNDSTKLIPKDVDLCVCTDLDEVFEPGWTNILRENYNGEDVVEYRYVWSHKENGEDDREFYQEKIHKPGLDWIYPVHECLNFTGKEKRLNLYNKLSLHHFPDHMKERDYLDLIRLRVKENPTDYTGRIYLAHELNYTSRYEESNEQIELILSKYKDHYDSFEIANLYSFYVKNLKQLNNDGDILPIINTAFKGIMADNRYCENYLLLAEILESKGYFYIAEGILKTMKQQAKQLGSWLETAGAFTYRYHDLLSLAYYYTEQWTEAYHEAAIACEQNPTDERLSNNKDLCFKALMNNMIGF